MHPLAGNFRFHGLLGVLTISHVESLLSSQEFHGITPLHNQYRMAIKINNLAHCGKEIASALKWANAPVRAWKDEQIDCNSLANTCIKEKMCGKYFQIVWRYTTRVGCCKTLCSIGGQQTEILVC